MHVMFTLLLHDLHNCQQQQHLKPTTGSLQWCCYVNNIITAIYMRKTLFQNLNHFIVKKDMSVFASWLGFDAQIKDTN